MNKFPKTLQLLDSKIAELENFLNTPVAAEPYECKLSTEELVSLFYKADLRVGEIIEAKKHPESQKLYIEKIDMGNGEIRQILSGLQQFYKEEEITGKCVVFYNLKPKPLAGLESAGMVVCASNKQHTEVVFLRPKEASQNGKRLILKNHPPKTSNEPFISNNNLKKFLELLRTDERGTPYFGTLEITGENFELIPSSIKNGNLS